MLMPFSLRCCALIAASALFYVSSLITAMLTAAMPHWILLMTFTLAAATLHYIFAFRHFYASVLPFITLLFSLIDIVYHWYFIIISSRHWCRRFHLIIAAELPRCRLLFSSLLMLTMLIFPLLRAIFAERLSSRHFRDVIDMRDIFTLYAIRDVYAFHAAVTDAADIIIFAIYAIIFYHYHFSMPYWLRHTPLYDYYIFIDISSLPLRLYMPPLFSLTLLILM